jgi:probable phosphoglycerate mutase
VEYGEWEGKKIKKLARKPMWRAVQFFPSRMQFPQGEALREVQFRAVQALEKIAAKHDQEVVVVVSHADVIRLLLAHYLGVHIDLFQRLVISPASASVLHLSSDGMVRVLRLNDDGPLHPPAQPESPEKGKKSDKKQKESRQEPEPSRAGDGSPDNSDAGAPAANGNKPARAPHPDQPVALDEEE